MATGTVKWFDEKKQYGFIVSDNSGGEVLIKPDAVKQAGLKHLNPGQKVTFELSSTPSGNVAAKAIKSL